MRTYWIQLRMPQGKVLGFTFTVWGLCNPKKDVQVVKGYKSN